MQVCPVSLLIVPASTLVSVVRFAAFSLVDCSAKFDVPIINPLTATANQQVSMCVLTSRGGWT